MIANPVTDIHYGFIVIIIAGRHLGVAGEDSGALGTNNVI